MSLSQQPIAVYDSGLGGLSVLRELLRLLPHENYLYFGDFINAPYGVKTPQQVAKLTLANTQKLLAQGAKAIVLACNTASSVALAPLRRRYRELPVIGMEPALKPAIEALPGRRVLVMATEMTLAEHKFRLLLERYGAAAHIELLPAPGIVECLEQGVISGGALDEYLWQLLAPWREAPIDGVVLGCTHFSFVRGGIVKALGYSPAIFDGAAGTARQTRRQLQNRDLLNTQTSPGQIELLNSSHDPRKLQLMQELLESNE